MNRSLWTVAGLLLLEATGDRAHDVMRAHLASHGYTPAPSLDSGDERLCRRIGLVVTHEVCAELNDKSADQVRVLWYVN